ncbi:MAG: hypothetical protein UT50_C0002G0007 [Candidatus Moranbacteria bacterium GW2011_GWA2_39_41]|nr:MAG: hypothetical protein UT50_C0002G0007 [Candidatus Moranbacteria bacterium GW2011_GWA2_39_41]
MCDKIYDVDLTDDVTPLEVRDAMIRCFVQAHAEVMQEMKEYHKFDSEEEFKKMEQMNVSALIRSIFGDIGADFDNPTKEDLAKVMNKLVDYAVNFRNPEIVKKHYDEMMLLFNKLK